MTRTKSTYLAVLAVLLSPMVANADLIDDTVLFQGCSLVPIFPTDCTGSPFFTEQISVVTADDSDSFQFGVSNTNVQANSILFVLDPGAGQEPDIFNGVLIRDMDWVGELGRIIGFTLSDNTMANFTDEHVSIFEDGHAIAINVGVPGIGDGRVTINLIVDHTQMSVPEPGTLALLGLGLAGLGLRRKKA